MGTCFQSDKTDNLFEDEDMVRANLLFLGPTFAKLMPNLFTHASVGTI